MTKHKYTAEDFARGVLRAGICTCNQQLNDIVMSYLKGAATIDDGHGSFVVSGDFMGDKNYNAFHQTHKYINNEFFYSEQNDEAVSVMGQAYYALGSKRSIISLLQESQRATDVRVYLDPAFKAILLKHEEDCEKLSKKYMQYVYEGKMTLKEAKEELKKNTPKLSGETYEPILIKAGYKGRHLEEAKKFVDIMRYQDTDARVIDFLDTYSLYHYYIFRKAVNHRFFKYLKEKPNDNLYRRRYMFETILKEEMAKHCHRVADEQNAHFRRDMLSLNTTRMGVEKAKKLALEINKAPEEIKKQLCRHIEHVINKSNPTPRKLVIKDIVIDPQTKVLGTSLLKNPSTVVKKREQSSGRLYTNVKTIFSDMLPTSDEKKKETPFVPPQPHGKGRIVEVSKLKPFISPRMEREKRKREERERRKKEKELSDSKTTQLDLFDRIP